MNPMESVCGEKGKIQLFSTREREGEIIVWYKVRLTETSYFQQSVASVSDLVKLAN